MKTQLIYGNDTAGEPGPEQAGANPANQLAYWCTNLNQRIDNVVMTRFVNMSKFFGRDITNEHDYMEVGTTPISPSGDKACLMKCFVADIDGGNLTVGKELHFRIHLTQWCKFTGRVKVAQS